MQSLFFWKSWSKDYRWIWYGTAGLFSITLIFLWYSYFRGADGVLHWENMQEQKVIETTVHSFRLGPFQLSIPAENYVIFEYFNGSDLEPNTTASYFFLVILAISAVMIFTVITTLERFWYYVGMALFILFVVSLRLEVLGLFGQFNRIPVVVTLALFVLPSFYINQFVSATTFVTRLLIFFGIAAALVLAIHFFSSVALPFYHLTLTGYTPGLVLTVLFIIMIAHEVFGAFVYVVSQGSSKSLRHLSIISVIYLANLVITCSHEMGLIEWNFFYINLYLLLSISALVGIWGFRDREPIYENIIPFHPFGSYFFLAMGAIGFATTGQLLGNANDPALKIIRDAIIFSQVGYGIVFLIYLVSNFIVMLMQSIPVYKILYKPTRMPYFTYRFAGMIATLAFVFYSNWMTYMDEGLSGFYNAAGDMYGLLGDDAYAQSFYEQAQTRGFMSNRSNYTLATIKASRFNFEGAHESYATANERRPTEYSLTNAGNVYVWEGDIFGAIQAYREANATMPGSGIIENNLGFAYSKVHNLDSALFYLSKARDQSRTKEQAETNFFGLVAVEQLPMKIDSIVTVLESSSTASLANAVAISTLSGESLSGEIDPLKNGKLDLYSATLLNNYLIRHVKELDTTFISRAYAIAANSVNADFSEALKASLAFAFYHQGNVSKALQILSELVYVSQSYQGKFNYIMGLWALEQGNAELASSYFTFADTYDYKQAKFYNAIALTEGRKVEQALQAWDVVLQRGDTTERSIARNLKRILTLPLSAVLTLEDADKYQYCRYRIGVRDSLAFDRISNTFDNANYKAQALLDFSKRYYRLNEFSRAIHYFNRIAGLELTDRTLYDEFRHTELLMLASRGEFRSLATQINKDITFDGSRMLEKMLFTALIAESSGDTATAKKNYEVLGRYNPYFEEGILAAADFFQKTEPKTMKAYTILAEAIQINANSFKLLGAYAAEAQRQGLDNYAADVMQRIGEIIEQQ